MDVDDRAARLDERRAPTAPPRSRMRIAATVLLLTGLAIAWFSFSRGAAPAAAPSATVVSPPPTQRDRFADTDRLRSFFADAHRCADVPSATPRIICEIDGVRVGARLLTVAGAQTAYRQRLGARIRPGQGAAACAHGAPDERSWSRETNPTVVVGRYRCRVESGRAAMWWTDDHGVLAHAVGVDRDLGRLFAWWLAHRDA
jgi:hypothetical protein